MGTGEFNAGGNTPSRFMSQKPEISAGLMDHLAQMQTAPLFTRMHCATFYQSALRHEQYEDVTTDVTPSSGCPISCEF